MAESVQIDRRFAEPEILFFGIGAQKAGTSWLNRFLRDHPEVCVPPGKELHYWTRIDSGYRGALENFKKRLQFRVARGDKNVGNLKERIQLLEAPDPTHSEYADVLFKRFDGQKAVGEITPDYCRLSRNMFEFLSNLNSDTRFIFLLRDPIERLHSAMRKRIRHTAGGDREFHIGDNAILEELKKVDGPHSAAVIRTRYDLTMENLESVVSPEKIGYFFYEDIFRKQDVDDICDFLSVSRMKPDFHTKVNRGNPTSEEIDPAFRQIAMKHVGIVYQRMADRFGDRLPSSWKRHLEMT